MDEYLFRKILTRVVAVPVVALLLLAVLLGVGLRGYKRSADRVDHTDRVIGQAHRMTNLMVDEETGSRGYLLTHESRFLEPLVAAHATMEAEFSQLHTLLQDNPSQVGKLDRIQATYREFSQVTARMVATSSASPEMVALTSRQKELMDENRRQLAEFESMQEAVRASRSNSFRLLQGWTLPLLVLAMILAALVTARVTWLSFREVYHAFIHQVREIRAQRDRIFEREQWLKTTLRSIGDGVIVCDRHGRIDFMNAVSEQLTGWREEDAKGKQLAEVFRILDEYTRETVESPVDKVRRMGVVVGLANHTVLVCKDNSERSIDDSGAPVRNAAGEITGVVLVFRDNHEKRLAEHALIRAEKLAAAGRLAATLAHEVNNPLEAVINLIYLAQLESNSPETTRSLKLAESEIHRIAHLTRQSLGFYRESVAQAAFRPAELVEEVVEFYGGQANRLNIKIRTVLKAKFTIVGARGELRQIANSIDAMGTNGEITIAVRDTYRSGPHLVKGVRIAVADRGKGIPGELKHKIFEPFFTTKEDVGTGLGLWVSRELVHKHGGRLLMRSRAGVGTVFLIWLPVERITGETTSGLGVEEDSSAVSAG